MDKQREKIALEKQIEIVTSFGWEYTESEDGTGDKFAYWDVLQGEMPSWANGLTSCECVEDVFRLFVEGVVKPISESLALTRIEGDEDGLLTPREIKEQLLKSGFLVDHAENLTEEELKWWQDMCQAQRKKIANNLPDMSEEEMRTIAQEEYAKEGFDEEVGYRRVRPSDYIKATVKACQDKLKKELEG